MNASLTERIIVSSSGRALVLDAPERWVSPSQGEQSLVLILSERPVKEFAVNTIVAIDAVPEELGIVLGRIKLGEDAEQRFSVLPGEVDPIAQLSTTLKVGGRTASVVTSAPSSRWLDLAEEVERIHASARLVGPEGIES